MASLTWQRLRELLHYDVETGDFTWLISTSNSYKVGDIAGTTRSTYCQISIEGVLEYAHRLVWLYVFGEWPREIIDHMDRVKRNNRLGNLRDVTSRVNNENTSRTNSTGLRGVFEGKAPGTFYAQIQRAGKLCHLGVFDSKIEAGEARAAARALLGST